MLSHGNTPALCVVTDSQRRRQPCSSALVLVEGRGRLEKLYELFLCTTACNPNPLPVLTVASALHDLLFLACLVLFAALAWPIHPEFAFRWHLSPREQICVFLHCCSLRIEQADGRQSTPFRSDFYDSFRNRCDGYLVSGCASGAVRQRQLLGNGCAWLLDVTKDSGTYVRLLAQDDMQRYVVGEFPPNTAKSCIADAITAAAVNATSVNAVVPRHVSPFPPRPSLARTNVSDATAR